MQIQVQIQMDITYKCLLFNYNFTAFITINKFYYLNYQCFAGQLFQLLAVKINMFTLC